MATVGHPGSALLAGVGAEPPATGGAGALTESADHPRGLDLCLLQWDLQLGHSHPAQSGLGAHKQHSVACSGREEKPLWARQTPSEAGRRS